ncbi:MAG: class I SAM-dependent methyltransferase [SAR202 cluster bacterium]|mgnify:CR=1 FL=1|jgi:SAM-dependent methyltransferase|nr:methyltransferase [Acidobacteriota bacterium]MDP6419911.1 class I SAM-dependent methyltransferase [SAR202 cluster bacterium]HAL46195.1 methyltransferase [Dehalococcoidia bacterium]MDP6663021.1 class I SAM-dependent methyltransferase [SAR202 cluster bacterium]MQG58422.1 class I SAM-dependent methyltransferase [SAR202 cluster bacterium]|tara:strand:+ start:7808 stop:9046 length:1239 start_codon:yes stop_codon:yes gene_type:complete
MARREACRICGGRQLSRFLDLGFSPLANRFLREDQLDEAEPRFRLDVFMCTDCSLVQLLEVVDPEILFRDYIYVSGTSETMRAHFAAFAESVATRFAFRQNELVLEVASNDGTFLSTFEGRGLRLLGVEPAVNIAEIARRRGIDTVNEFFGARLGHRVRQEYGAAACVLATNVFAHVDDLDGFVRGVHGVLGPEGIFIFENSYVRDMLDRLEFDSVYHEHLSYFSVTALSALFERHGMEIFDVEHQSVHGGSLRVFVKRRGAGHPVTQAPARFRDEERRSGLREVATYEAFAARVHDLRTRLLTLLKRLRREGKRVVAYGSSAKGNTLLNFMGIGPDLVTYLVDKSPLKQGTFSPGMHLPVLPVEHLMEDRPDYALVLAWNFIDEIVRQQHRYVEGGGHFIVPIPTPRIVPA